MKRRVKATENVAAEYGREEFTQALARTSKAYRTTVIESGVAVAVGIITAINIKLFYGVVICVIAAVYYALSTALTLKKELGISYRTVAGALTVTKYDAKGRESAWIPRKLLWLDVTEIGAGAFSGSASENLCRIHLPRTITYIGADAFADCPKLSCIYFEGSAEQWAEIESMSDLSVFCVELDSQLAPTDEKASRLCRLFARLKSKKAKNKIEEWEDSAE